MPRDGESRQERAYPPTVSFMPSLEARSPATPRSHPAIVKQSTDAAPPPPRSLNATPPSLKPPTRTPPAADLHGLCSFARRCQVVHASRRAGYFVMVGIAGGSSHEL